MKDSAVEDPYLHKKKGFLLWRERACCNALPTAAMHTGRGHGHPAADGMTDAVEHMIQTAELPHLLKEAKQQLQGTQALCTWSFFNLVKCNFFTLWNHVEYFSLKLNRNFAFQLLIQAAERDQ